MSINVTVTGNPVSITRGKMVTADPDYGKKEFQKRRRMRLEQVRQQSKDIAENVRSKVRKERRKQLSEIEQEGANKLKEWQSQKLLELQQQYCENLKDIGLGHTGAAVEETCEDLVSAYKDVLREKSKEQGYVAAKQLHNEKEDHALAKALKSQQRKGVRNLENSRSAMVSKIKTRTQNSPFKKKKQKKPVTNINISSIVNDSESGLDSDASVEESSDNYTRSSPSKLKPELDEVTTTTTLSKTESPKKSRIAYEKQIFKKKRKSSPEINRSPPGSPEPVKHTQKIMSPPEKPFNFPLDTRISDRIKRRLNIPLNQPITKSYLQENFVSKVTQSSPAMDEISTQTKVQPLSIPVESSTELQIPKADFRCQPCNHPSVDKACQLWRSTEDIRKTSVRETCTQPCKRKENVIKSSVTRRCDDIPEKPRVTLKSSSRTSKFDGGDFNKVQYYDHANRYSKEYLCDNSCVQKIQDDSIHICPSTSSEQEFVEKIYKRDHDALVRGKKAMEREKIHREYKEMMQLLPVLQKQERIASINSNNPVFHMSDERLKLYELKRQNQMEEAYEKYFPNASLITVPPKKHDVQTQPFRVIDVSNNQPALNLAIWDEDSISKDIIVMKDDGLISVGAETAQDRTDYLKNLLDKLKMQKEMLIREVDSLPKDSNLHNLIKEMEGIEESKETLWKSVHELRDEAREKVTSSAVENGDCYCPELGSYHNKGSRDAKKLTKKVPSQHLRTKHKILLSSSNSSTSPSPRKKSKHRKYTLVLQNTSTQTTPKKLAKSVEPRAIQQPQKHTISSDTRHFEIQIGEDKSRSPKKKSPSKKMASSQTDFTSQAKVVLSSTTTDKDKVDSTAPSLKTDEKGKNAKVKERRTLPSPNIPQSPRSRHVKGSSSSYASDNVKPPCECKDEVCEILIKIKDEEPEIVIKSPKNIQKPLLVKADIQKNIKKRPQSKKQLQFQTEKQPDLSKDKLKSDVIAKTTSWKEHFSKSNSLGTSTSTSYYSPPDFRSSTKRDLKEQLDPRLLTYIRKLLTMSRASVEDLGVSSVSDISTPTPSLMNDRKNEPLNQLRNIIKYFNLNPDELARCLNSSNETDDNTRGSSTSTSSLFVSHRYRNGHKKSNASGSNVSDYRSSSTDKSMSIKSQNDSQKYKAVSARIEKIVEQTARNIEGSNVRQMSLEAYTDQNYPSALSQYTKIAEMCHQRISNLSEMIQKVRQEKQQILSPNISDKENSTSYMNLPSRLGTTSAMSEGPTARPNTPNMSGSSGSEVEQSELTRKLLEIDYSLVDKLQKLSPAELKKQVAQLSEPQTTSPKHYTDGEMDNDLMTRYRALLGDEDYNNPSKVGAEQLNEEKQPEAPQTNQVNISDKQSSNVPFIPLLLDIPRLPKLTLSSMKTNFDENEEKTKAAIQDAFSELNHSEKKPPPSKGLSAAKKFNNNITGVPHELSTIVEVDSQLSTKARQSASPVNSDHHIFENIKPLVVSPNPQSSIWTTQAVAKPLSDESLPDILTELAQQPLESQSSSSTEKPEVNHNEGRGQSGAKPKIPSQKQLNMFRMAQVIADQSTDSSTDRSELENIEAMLKSMGMGWAVATIRKTHEALTRTSSSSSLEVSIKRPVARTSDKCNSSDVSLRQFLDNKLFDRCSGSGSKTTDSSLSPFLRELQEISAIHGSGGSSETKNQRTSTPVQTTKSSDKSKSESQKGMFPMESDLSSVKSKPDDMFMTMPSDISTSTGSQSKSSDL